MCAICRVRNSTALLDFVIVGHHSLEVVVSKSGVSNTKNYVAFYQFLDDDIFLWNQ